MNRYVTSFCAALLVLTAVSAWATTYPAYTCTYLKGYSDNTNQTSNFNSYGETLLPNGTVIGLSTWQPPSGTELPENNLVSWTSSGTMTNVYNFETSSITNAFGDTSGRYVAPQVNVPGYGSSAAGLYTYIGGTLSRVSQSALHGTNINLEGMTQNGLAAGYFDSSTNFAYDVATSTYYTFGPANSWVQAVGGSTAGNGYVVGGDGNNYDGFVWSQSNQSYVQIPALAAAQGISNNGNLVAGLTQGSNYQAAVYTPSGTPVGTYWAGEATGVNNNGLVIGDNSDNVYNGAGTWNNCQAMAYFPGYGSVNLNVYAPNGVTFNTAQAVNDLGQILVWSDGSSEATTGVTSYLLTPVTRALDLVAVGRRLAGTGGLRLAETDLVDGTLTRCGTCRDGHLAAVPTGSLPEKLQRSRTGRYRKKPPGRFKEFRT